jgi:alpha-aminoadipic semialdehyde synthase
MLQNRRCVGIVREVYNKWERRVPLCPSHVETLVKQHNIPVVIQPSTRRFFSDVEFERAGAKISDDLSEAGLILGVKQVPIQNLLSDRMYMFFR